MFSDRISRFAGGLTTVACALGIASVSFAAPQQFSVAGQVTIQAGALQLPVNGATPGQNFIARGLDAVGTMKTGTTMYQFSPAQGRVGNCSNCITQDISPGRSQPFLTVKPAVFTAPLPPASIGGFRGFPLASVASLAQLTTRIFFSAPDPALGTAMLSGRMTGAVPTFTWCPGPIGLDCTTITQGDPDGTGPSSNPNALIRYSGGNGFGGVMHNLLSTVTTPGGNLVRYVNATPLRGRFEEIGGSGSFGGGGDFTTEFFPADGNAPVHTILGSTPGGFITEIVPTPTTNPPNTEDRTDWALPYTTGMITLIALNAVNPLNVTLTLSGSDTRGSDGEGRLTLVAGAVNLGLTTKAFAQQRSTAQLLIYTPEPATWLAAGSALFALGLGRTITRRKA
jgi:hypothetical protein